MTTGSFFRRALPLAALCLLTTCTVSCSDTNLYSPSHELRQPDRVGLTGRVCTEDPVEAEFPLRIILLVDEANGPLYGTYDTSGERFQVLRDFISAATTPRQNEIAVIGYAGQPRLLTSTDQPFGRNPGDLNNAITQLQNPVGCFAENQCRNLRDAMSLARSIIEDDLFATPRGLRALTQYTVINLHSGPPSPLADGADCCADGDVQCRDEQSGPSFECEAQLAGDAVAGIREAIAGLGGAGLRYHTIHWAAEEVIDGDTVDDDVQTVLESMAFTGRGSYQRFNQVFGFNFPAVNLTGDRVPYHARILIASNMNVLPGPDGPRVDSDRDGLADEEEEFLGTSPTNRDSTGDGISDLVKVMAGLNPALPEPEPFPGCEALPTPDYDSTSDGLTDCDNRVLGLDPTLVDSSGDGIPDVLEVYFGTNFLARDSHLDYDGDGVPNGEEIRQHTDPTSNDSAHHLTYSYRYDITDEGFIRDLRAQRFRRLTGVEISHISAGTTAGVGTVFFDADGETLRWVDASDDNTGPAVSIHGEQPLLLPSGSWAPEQGEDGRFVEVTVRIPDLPTETLNEATRIVFRDRQCLSFTVRNIKLMETLELDDGTPAGTNQLLLFFGQAPDGRMDVPGPFRLASIPVRYQPPDQRQPADALIPVANEQFVRPRLLNAPWELVD